MSLDRFQQCRSHRRTILTDKATPHEWPAQSVLVKHTRAVTHSLIRLDMCDKYWRGRQMHKSLREVPLVPSTRSTPLLPL